MKQFIIATIFFVVICLSLSFAQGKGPCGIYGFVYDNNNNKAGDSLVNIYIIKTTDPDDTASYYYNSGTSYYVTNDVYGLSNGTWRLQGEISVNGTTYWSNWYVKSWQFPQFVQQDIYCNSTVRPAWNPD